MYINIYILYKLGRKNGAIHSNQSHGLLKKRNKTNIQNFLISYTGKNTGNNLK